MAKAKIESTKRGRPTVFSDRLALALIALAERGATDEEMAVAAGIDVRTLYRWKEAHPDFCQALKEKKDLADDFMEDALYKTGMSGNVTAQIFWLKNRQPKRWRDRQEIVSDGIAPFIVVRRDGTTLELGATVKKDEE